MNHVTETVQKNISPKQDSRQSLKTVDIQKIKGVRKMNYKGHPITKRKYNKKNNQIHIHSICFAVKESNMLKVDRIETQTVDESRNIKKINGIELSQIIQKRDSEKLKKIINLKECQKFECQYPSAHESTAVHQWNWGIIQNSGLPGTFLVKQDNKHNYLNWPIQPYGVNEQNWIGCPNWMNSIG